MGLGEEGVPVDTSVKEEVDCRAHDNSDRGSNDLCQTHTCATGSICTPRKILRPRPRPEVQAARTSKLLGTSSSERTVTDACSLSKAKTQKKSTKCVPKIELRFHVHF
jgi:hypothetical protein